MFFQSVNSIISTSLILTGRGIRIKSDDMKALTYNSSPASHLYFHIEVAEWCAQTFHASSLAGCLFAVGTHKQIISAQPFPFWAQYGPRQSSAQFSHNLCAMIGNIMNFLFNIRRLLSTPSFYVVELIPLIPSDWAWGWYRVLFATQSTGLSSFWCKCYTIWRRFLEYINGKAMSAVDWHSVLPINRWYFTVSICIYWATEDVPSYFTQGNYCNLFHLYDSSWLRACGIGCLSGKRSIADFITILLMFGAWAR